MSLKESNTEYADHNTSFSPKPDFTAKSLAFGRAESGATQFFRYVVVGTIAFLCDAGLLSLLVRKWHVNNGIAAAVGFIVGLTICYILSIRWVFATKRIGSAATEFTVFAVIGVIGLIFTELIIKEGVRIMGQNRIEIAKVISTAIVFVWNFGARRALLMRGARKQLQDA